MALRAARLKRNTTYRLENGDPGVACAREQKLNVRAIRGERIMLQLVRVMLVALRRQEQPTKQPLLIKRRPIGRASWRRGPDSPEGGLAVRLERGLGGEKYQ